MPSAGFERAIPATKRQQTYALDRAATGIGIYKFTYNFFIVRYHLRELGEEWNIKRIWMDIKRNRM
jgi:hypothetical protein